MEGGKKHGTKKRGRRRKEEPVSILLNCSLFNHYSTVREATAV